MASIAEKLDPELWEQAKADARDVFGGHSARAMQYATKLYQERGGRYRGPKKKDNRLTQWTRQDWRTKSGRPSRETGERYLPAAAIESLTPAEYGATTRAKRRGGGVGKVVAQPQSIREKTRKFRKVNPDMATAKQIAARKKFAERARSGELAKMRKKTTRKKNPMEGGFGNRYEIRRRGIGMAKYPIASYSDLGLAKDYLDEIDRPVGTHYGYDTKTKEVFNSFAFETRNMKRNPAKTVSQEISQQMRKGKGQKQAVAIALEMERAGKLKKNPSTRWRVPEGDDKYIFDPYGMKGLTVVAEKTMKEDGYVSVDLSVIYNEPKGVYQYAHGGVIEKEHTPSEVTAKRLADLWYKTNREDFRAARRNPTATRLPAKARTKLISNGREKNPAKPVGFTFYDVLIKGPRPGVSEKGQSQFMPIYSGLSLDEAKRKAMQFAKIYPQATIKVESRFSTF